MEAPTPAPSPSIATVLSLVDGSEPSTRALQVAIEVAQRYGSKLITLSVITAPVFLPVGTGGSPTDLSMYYEEGTVEAKRAVDDAVKLADAAGVSSRGEVIEASGSTVETIVDFASRENVDLIVMGTRGLGGLKKLVLGSVSSGVVAHAHCSVLIVR